MTNTNITVSHLFELLRDAVSRAQPSVLKASDDDLARDLFEEFDVGAISFLHESSLTRLRAADLVDDNAVGLCTQLRAHWLTLQSRDWSLPEVRSAPEWRAFFTLAAEVARALDGAAATT
ncbi:MAG: hypothetical protein U0271_15350 [Polyangiaceae bacterium]